MECRAFLLFFLLNFPFISSFLSKIRANVVDSHCIFPTMLTTRKRFCKNPITQSDIIAVDITERDQAWLNEGNKVEYVAGGEVVTFNSLGLIGLNISEELSSRNVVPHHLTTGSDLFCNRELNMGQIEAVGFDMDWTLAQYNEEFDLLAFEGSKQKLVFDLGYPEEVLNFEYSQTAYRRGFIIDKKRGNILKLDQYNYVRRVEHGRVALTPSERKTLYMESSKETQSFSGSNFVSIDTPFSLVDATLYMQLVHLKDSFHRIKSNHTIASSSYEQLWTDMRACVEKCHKDGVIKKTVALNPGKYITYDPNIFPMLDGFKRSGRKVFLLTNSLWDYTQVVMNYLEGRKSGTDKDFSWTKYFDVVIVGGNKPAFLKDNNLAFFRVDPVDESLQNIETFPETPNEVDSFLSRGKTFQGGHAQLLHKLLQVSSGDRLLYVGDHIFADILRSKRSLGWRTCLIIPELTDEIISHKKSRMKRGELFKLRRQQFDLVNELDDLQFKMLIKSQAQSDPANRSTVAPDLISDRELLLELSQQLIQLRADIAVALSDHDKAFHPRWGPLFKAGFQVSRFARQAIDFACIYTSRASNLGLVSPQRPFRALRDRMPHEHFLEGLKGDL